uniref:EF-hand domain-containing protein n=1 Tax=Fervidobacterium pennivorans TaxID=93466 RepID=A0A7V4FG85_FERPE
MKKLVLLLAILLSLVVFAGSFSIPVIAGQVEVPVVVQMGKLVDMLPEDFEPDWTSLRILVEGVEVPFQIEDVDGNGRISAPDYLVFIAKGNTQIVVQDAPGKAGVYPKAFEVVKDSKGWTIKAVDESIEAVVNDHGLLQVTKFGSVKAKLVDEVGIARVSGWYNSTYYVDGKLGDHHEETSGAFRVVSLKVLDPGPVAVCVVAVLKSEKFNGLKQELVTHLFKNGDILVDNRFVFETYADMMKLQTMITRPIIPAFDDTLHILPVFRRLVWADQLNITPYEYWLQRNAITWVDNMPYITFPAGSSMKPLWWGATYIFASMERWRTNFSPKGKIGVAEILPEIPVYPADYKKWLDGDTWVYESLEFRDGVFKWMPGEFEAYPSTTGVYSMKVEDMPNRYKAGDIVQHLRLYSIYSAKSVEEAIKFIEAKSNSFRSLKIGE